MFENIKNLNDGLRNIKELRKMMSDPANQSPEKLMEALGVDFKDFEDDFQKMMTPDVSVELEYVYKSVNPEPSYAYPTDSGFDLYSTEEVHLAGFERKLVSTGLFVNIPDGFEKWIGN